MKHNRTLQRVHLFGKMVLLFSCLLFVAAKNNDKEQRQGQGTNRPGISKAVSLPVGVSNKKSRTRRFDRRVFDRQVKALKKIAAQKTTMKNIHMAIQKTESVQSSRRVLTLEKQNPLKLFGKTSRFSRAPVLSPSARKASVSRAMVSNVLINGKARDTIYAEEPFTLTFSISPNSLSAIVNLYLDVDGDGIVGPDDILLGNMLVLDNSDVDENPATGEITMTFGSNDLLSRIVSSLILEVDDYQSVSSAALTVQQKPTSSIVQGTIFPNKAFIPLLVESAQDEEIIFTDSTGKFFFYVDQGQTNQVSIFPLDITGVTNGYIPPKSNIVNITSDTTLYNITYTEAKSFIEGYAKDRSGNVIKDVSIDASGSFNINTKTDSTGYYRIGVDEGQWYLYPTIGWTSEYLPPSNSNPSVLVYSNSTVHQDLVFTESNSTISGKVTFNAGGVGGIPIYASADTLSNNVISSGDGSYSIPVYKPSIGIEQYTVDCSVSSGYYVDSSIRINIQPGATNLNFSVEKVKGGLAGKVTDIKTGMPIPNATIFASGAEYGYALSNDSGYYRMSLLDGQYSLSAEANSYYTYTESGVYIAGVMVTKNIQLLRSGSFSGMVKDADGKPVPFVSVMALDSAGVYQQGAGYTDGDGNYSVSNLGTGMYTSVVMANGYMQQWYNKADVAVDATPFRVMDGFDTPHIDFALSRGGSISGKVVDKTGAPIAGVEVLVLDTLYDARSYTTTDDSGGYIASGLATGKYFVATFSELYFTQWYDGAGTQFNAEKVNVVVNQTTSGINFILLHGGVISGTVKNRDGVPISEAEVSVLDSTYSPVSYNYTDNSGYYISTWLQPGKKYYVTATDYEYAQQWYNNVSTPDSATFIVLQDEETREHIDFNMSLEGSISGRVFDKAGKPIPLAYISVVDSAGDYIASGSADQNGNYSVASLSNGKYYVEADDYGYNEQWFDHKASMQQADKVNVVEETVTLNINFDLDKAAGISGTVVDDSTSTGIANIQIQVVQKEYGSQYFAYTDYSGAYFLPLPAGDYVLSAYDPTRNYLTQYYASAGCVPREPDAQVITVVDAQPPVTADFRLPQRKPYAVLTKSKLGMTITNSGQLGSDGDTTLPSGRWPLVSGPNYLYEGDVWVGGTQDNTPRVSGDAYQGLYGIWAPTGNFTVSTNDTMQKVSTIFSDLGRGTSYGMGFDVRLSGSSKKNADNVVLHYTVYFPPGLGTLFPVSLKDIYVGLYMDFDVSMNGQTDQVGIDTSDHLIYMYDATNLGGTNIGVKLLSPTLARLIWWKNGDDPMNDTARYAVMTKGAAPAMPTTASDYRIFVSAGPFTMSAGDSVGVDIAIVAGNGADGIISAAKKVTGVGQDAHSETVPTNFALYQNYPNPFNPSTTVEFSIPRSGRVTLKVYDMLGREVAQLVNDQLNAGTYKATWNASNVASGVYLCRMEAHQTDGGQGGTFTSTKKIILLK